uniref:Cyclin-like domain-containing protein n=1 Tax=Ananas comosus var. bracteatus TaxID=296719 RepID=A0A6V7P7U9_ANACO|nr:unnamed protein product [Ananas comosus var. bracteatus]
MASFPLGGSSRHVMSKGGPYGSSHERPEEPEPSGAGWYFSRKDIEENSPSRQDGIDLKKETYLRKSYCTLLQDLGMRLKVPQVTIATAIVFCHRFFLRQSHVKNDRRTIATVCMFLAGKVEETPRPLKDVILVSYEIIHKKDPSAIQRIKQKEVYEQQKELILLGERLVLATLGFDLNMHHPYKPLVEAIKKFKVAQNALAQVAWNFVNDGLRTALCLQYKSHHIAAGAIFLAAKFLKVKLPSDGEKSGGKNSMSLPAIGRLSNVSNQMLELYEQNRPLQSSHANEAEGNTGGGSTQAVAATSTLTENSISPNVPAQDATAAVYTKPGAQESGYADSHNNVRQYTQKGNRNGSSDTKGGVWDHNLDNEDKDYSNLDDSVCEAAMNVKSRATEVKETKDEKLLFKPGISGGRNNKYGEAAKGYSPSEAITKIDKDKVKAALEKRRKLGNGVVKKNDIIDEDDLIEKELEDGIELADDENKRQQSAYGKRKGEYFDRQNRVHLDRSFEMEFESAEEGELSSMTNMNSF